ncbi:hypothetical protein [Bradyrhizobium cenepequi]
MRQVRRVPSDWKHPRDGVGRYIPLEESAPDEPSPDPVSHMPAWPTEARTHWQLYEVTTEGTPVSPPCASARELAKWLADNRIEVGGFTGTEKQWRAAIERGGLIPVLMMKGKSFVNPLDD